MVRTTVTLSAVALCVSVLFFVICDLSLNRRLVAWNLFVIAGFVFGKSVALRFCLIHINSLTVSVVINVLTGN